MANELKMDTKQAITSLANQGWSQRRIAKDLGVHRRTVTRLIKSIDDSKGAISMTGNGPGRTSKCEPFRASIEAKLESGLDAKRIYEDLQSEAAFEGSYASVQRFVKALRSVNPKRVWRMEVEPGEEAQIDYGTMMLTQGEDGRPKRTQLLRITLSFSRKSYSEAMLRQDTESFIRGLENALRHFGGVPVRLCPDNLKAAILKAHWHDPEVNPKLLSFARHYDTAIMPTRPRSPQHKGKIERNIKSPKRELKGRSFKSLADLNEYLRSWESNVSDQRIHGTTKRQVQEHFLCEEKSALRPLPSGLFPCYQEGRRKVGRDCYVIVEGAFYDVPEQYMGRHVWVRWDARMVRVLDASIELICSHARIAAGKFTSVLGADGRRGSFEESAAYWRKRCSRIGCGAGGWADGVIANRDQMAVRIMQGLVSMTGKYSKNQIEKPCVKAALHGQYRLSDLKSWISSPQNQESFSFMESHEIIRQPGSYDQSIGSKELFDGN
jgi:transposase